MFTGKTFDFIPLPFHVSDDRSTAIAHPITMFTSLLFRIKIIPVLHLDPATVSTACSVEDLLSMTGGICIHMLTTPFLPNYRKISEITYLYMPASVKITPKKMYIGVSKSAKMIVNICVPSFLGVSLK